MTLKFSAFAAGTVPGPTDILVGLQGGVNTQFTALQLFQSLVAEGLRSKLLAPTTVYVSPSGSDAVPYVLNSAGNPWKTLLHAWNVMCGSFDIGGQVCTIQMADGTYTDNIVIGGASATTNFTPIGGGTILFQGNLSNPTNVQWNGGAGPLFYNFVPVTSLISFSNFLGYNNSGTFQPVFGVGAYMNETLLGVSFGTAGGSFVQQIAPSNVAIGGQNFSITAANTFLSPPFLAQVTGAVLNIDGLNTFTCTATAAQDWSGTGQGFIEASSGANVFAGLPAGTFITSGAGSYTGSKYTAQLNGVIQTFGQGGNAIFPGNSNGTTATGGQIDTP